MIKVLSFQTVTAIADYSNKSRMVTVPLEAGDLRWLDALF